MKISAFSKTYNGRKVLDFPGIELESGKIYAIIGANGSGKSTFAKVLAGVEKADRKGRLTDTAIGYMPQKNFGFRMSTQANILLGSREYKLANKLMDDLQIAHLCFKRADRLSGGETARMALARLMVRNFDAVLLDEPTAAMDMESTLLAEKVIADYVQRTHCTLILVTHSLQQARRIADEVLYFHKGQLLESGPKEKMLNDPDQPETRQFLDFYGI